MSARRTVAEPAPPAAPVAAAPAPVAAAARVQRPAVKTKPHVPQHGEPGGTRLNTSDQGLCSFSEL